jgi:hypothetical protein
MTKSTKETLRIPQRNVMHAENSFLSLKQSDAVPTVVSGEFESWRRLLKSQSVIAEDLIPENRSRFRGSDFG